VGENKINLEEQREKKKQNRKLKNSFAGYFTALSMSRKEVVVAQ
jgi:ribosomal protein S17E